MSRFPAISTAGEAVPASIFARLREHLAKFPGDFIPLQIGDTHLPPAQAIHDIPWTDLSPTDLYTYGSPNGWTPLVDAIVDKVTRKNAIPVTPGCIQIACGATHALSCAVQALCDPGDELILLTPHWPLIRGMALGLGVVPVEVPFDPLEPGSSSPLEPGSSSPLEPGSSSSLEAAITPRTTAIYFATPNNPDGRMLSRTQLEAIAEVARRHDLWILADEVYEDYTYDAAHVSIAALAPDLAARTVTVFSFAKSFAQAGLRVGYAVASDAIAGTIKKLVNHSVYNVPVAMQRAALGAMQRGPEWTAAARDTYRAARDRALAKVPMPAERPPGGAYLWVDLRRWTGDDCMPALERFAAAGVLLAPGSAFGAACAGFARLCFTGVTPERLDEGIARITEVLEKW